MLVDLPLAELRRYVPDIADPADFTEFWDGQMESARARGGQASFTAADSRVRHARVFDVTFPGHGGDPIKGWFIDPRESDPGAAVIVEFIGYGGGRGDPFDWLKWSCAGHPHLVVDTRGQGGRWRSADTPDLGDNGAPSTPGFLTRGIASPHSHYYTRLFVDAARAVDAIGDLAAGGLVTGRPIVTTGASQGGGLAIAAAHLAVEVVATMPDVPFLADFRRAVEVTDADPYVELAYYCKAQPDKAEQAFSTLSFVDVANHGKRVGVPALFSVGLADTVTPPSTVFAAYNHYAGPKDIAVYQFSGHEGGGTRHFLAQLTFLANHGLG